MIEIPTLSPDLIWPAALLLAWLAGEYGHRFIGLPRISTYGVVGVVLAFTQVGVLPAAPPAHILLLANIAFGLLLFEAGYRLHLGWLRNNPWIAVTSLAEASLTFVAVYALGRWAGASDSTALLLAALSMATSPATVVRVVHEERSSGQVTERVLHLAVLNCVLAVLVFKVVVGLVIFETSGNLLQAISGSLVVLVGSVALGLLMGALLPEGLRALQDRGQDTTLAYALAVIFLVTLTHALHLSPALAALTFGLMTRQRRMMLSRARRGFGVLGEVLTVLLFVFVGSTLEWRQVWSGLGLGLLIVAVRYCVKLLAIGALAHASGISVRKGLLIGTAMTPFAAFVILVLERTGDLGPELVDRVAPLAAAALVLELIGPVLTQRALVRAREGKEL